MSRILIHPNTNRPENPMKMTNNKWKLLVPTILMTILVKCKEVLIAGLPPQAKGILTVLANHEHELLKAFSVISPGRVRIRKNP